MKRALLVGIDTYKEWTDLDGCVNDVVAVEKLLARHADGSPNFQCHVLRSNREKVTRRAFTSALNELFGGGADVALLYFAGHGEKSAGDVVLRTYEGDAVDPGIPLSTILGKVQESKATEVIIVLDCCYSGGAGGVPALGGGVALIREGVTLLTAARKDQVARETPDGRGLFSSLLCAALDGGAADVCGGVNAAGLYAYLSESLGPWDQRPTFKANLDALHELRRCAPAVPVEDLRRLARIFRAPGEALKLDPSYEPTAAPRNAKHEAVFATLQRCRAAKLVEPVGTPHMYDAAMQRKSCRLTPLGQHYWRLADEDLL
ncbi:MAG TPA: caspase family protein [Gemmatimonadaceae bacterium]|nr:caspase family protein [Gemmatimonadaceae bacterium]